MCDRCCRASRAACGAPVGGHGERGAWGWAAWPCDSQCTPFSCGGAWPPTTTAGRRAGCSLSPPCEDLDLAGRVQDHVFQRRVARLLAQLHHLRGARGPAGAERRGAGSWRSERRACADLEAGGSSYLGPPCRPWDPQLLPGQGLEGPRGPGQQRRAWQRLAAGRHAPPPPHPHTPGQSAWQIGCRTSGCRRWAPGRTASSPPCT